MPAYSRYSAPHHLTISNAVADAASNADSPSCRGERMHDAAGRDAEHRGGAVAKAARRAARGDVRHVRARA